MWQPQLNVKCTVYICTANMWPTQVSLQCTVYICTAHIFTAQVTVQSTVYICTAHMWPAQVNRFPVGGTDKTGSVISGLNIRISFTKNM